MPRPKLSQACVECGAEYYARGMCKPHYMASNRSDFKAGVVLKPKAPEMDMDDFWEFVKKELKIG